MQLVKNNCTFVSVNRRIAGDGAPWDNDMLSTYVEILVSGFDGHVAKPADFDALLALIQDHFAARRGASLSR